MDATSPQQAGFLTRERIVASAGYNRWLVPPCALAIHLCIGMIYGMSVFWLPLTKMVGGAKALACPAGTGLVGRLTATNCDWLISDLSLVFSIGIVFLGASAALWGGWLERAGPRKAGLVAAICWPGGLAIAAVGIFVHQLWLVWLGGGVIGGIGLGLGYISPVSTLIKWFPDRRGMATGMAIMGFGGGAMIGSPLAVRLIATYHTASSPGVAETFLTLAAIYFVFMTAGAFGYRVPPRGYHPHGDAAHAAEVAKPSVPLNAATLTPQFWLLFAVLCLNVSAGIGVLDLASPMLQEIFGGSLIGHPELPFTKLAPDQLKVIAGIAAGFAGLLSLFNILGRFFWASMSDLLGRKGTYATFFLLGIVLYAAVPSLAAYGNKPLFALTVGVILSMYGGGFATIPAYLADVFGTGFVGAIHGRLLLAWSLAGVIGPLLITSLRQSQIDAGVPRANVYDHTMYILAGLLAVGFVCNLLVRPVPEEKFTAVEPKRIDDGAGLVSRARSGGVFLPLAWLAVCLPLAWGFYQTVLKTAALFTQNAPAHATPAPSSAQPAQPASTQVAAPPAAAATPAATPSSAAPAPTAQAPVAPAPTGSAPAAPALIPPTAASPAAPSPVAAKPATPVQSVPPAAAHAAATPTLAVPVAVPQPKAPAFVEPATADIPAGKFSMGSREDPSEMPVHTVSVGAFKLAKTPVTVGEWNLCAAAGACKQAAGGSDDRPVVNASWQDAQAYAAWLSKASGHAWRLPSEAEWEYAARSGTTTRYWWGAKMLPGHANCASCGTPAKASTPPLITDLPPNGYGLLGMGGGVTEWVQDCWHDDYQGAPATAAAWETATCGTHVLRGGGWMEDASAQRVSSREYFDTAGRYPTFGFRLVAAQ
jgi:formylglycine-generating enzyme required for sulfatase activity